jgi:hypothetical protein
MKDEQQHEAILPQIFRLLEFTTIGKYEAGLDRLSP